MSVSENDKKWKNRLTEELTPKEKTDRQREAGIPVLGQGANLKA